MVEEHDVIDQVGRAPDGTTGLMMFEPRDWRDEARQIDDLRKKVQVYFSYVTDGDMARDNPCYANRPVWFRVVCHHRPPRSVHAVLAQLSDALSKHGIALQLAHFDPQDPSTGINNVIPIGSKYHASLISWLRSRIGFAL